MSDGDSKISKAVRECHGLVVETQRDPRHFGNGILKKIVSVDFRLGTFKGKNKQIREKYKKWFANDLVRRCNAEFSAAANKCKSICDSAEKKNVMTNLLKDMPECIISCATKHCHTCSSTSFVCDGQSSWFSTEATYTDDLDLCEKDQETLKNIISKRLGPEGIALTYRNKNTQMNEAINRGFCKVNPKNVTCSRNFFARTSREVLTINKGFEGSLSLIHEAIGHKVSATIGKKISRREIIRQRKQNSQKSLRVKRKRRLGIIRKYRIYQNKLKGENKDINEPYQKHVDLDLNIKTDFSRSTSQEAGEGSSSSNSN